MKNNILHICNHRCIIGEGPLWNSMERKLYFTNGWGNEFCKMDVYSGEFEVIKLAKGVAAFSFTKDNRLLVSCNDGVFILKENGIFENIYDTQKVNIKYGNDMKVGPDGCIYVGTQSGKWFGDSEKIDGKLYRIDKFGNVKVLLDNLKTSNGLDWSADEKYFYHTDSPDSEIKEYAFDKKNGEIEYTGRNVFVKCVDGFTVDDSGNIIAACWGQGHLAVIDTKTFKIKDYIELSCKVPTSCSFAGDNMELLAVTTASYTADITTDINAGMTHILKYKTNGKKVYLYG